jgi:N-acetyl-alpha-D-glucosaminyl L-malate synthase BshA
MSKLRIGISCYPTYGGSGVIATELAHALARDGEEVHVLSYDRPRRLDTTLPGITFHLVTVPQYPLFEYPPYSLALATKMVEVAKRHRLDVLHVHYAVPNAVSAILARQILAPARLPVVTTLHGTDVTLIGNDPSYIETTRYGVMQSDRVTAVSDWLRRTTLEQLAIEREIDVIPNFVDEERFTGRFTGRFSHLERALPEELRARCEEPRVPQLIHISNFRPVKRTLDTVEILHRVRAAMPARLVLIGDGPERPSIEQRVRELGLEEVVTWLGERDAVEPYLSEADVLLQPSAQESFGLAALEAMACGVPVVGSAVGGLREVVLNGETGLLYPMGDVAGMAEGVVAILRDPQRQRRYGQAGRRRALETYDRARAVRAYREVYERAMAGVAATL